MNKQMIERVARRMCSEAGHDPDTTCDIHIPGDPDAIFAWAGYRSDATSAIAQAIADNPDIRLYGNAAITVTEDGRIERVPVGSIKIG